MTAAEWFKRIQDHIGLTREEVEALLRDFEAAEAAQYPGCKVLSLSDACTCKLCVLEKRAEAAEARAQAAEARVRELEAQRREAMDAQKPYVAPQECGGEGA